MSAEPSVFAGRLARLGERLNPVLVKEVRAALRGRAFAVGFVVVLVLAMVASSIAMLIATAESHGTPSGVGYLIAVSVVFGLGAHGLVPFSAMASMSAEHDERSLELLQLSGISPARLVLGKLGAAAVQAALIYAAFLPFLSFAFLLEGVDLAVLAIGITGSYVVSLTLSSIGILFGATLGSRWMRVIGFVVLAITMILTVQGIAALLIGSAMIGTASASPIHFLVPLAVAGFVAATCCAHATSRLQHAEENRSTGYRVLGTVAVVVACAFGLAAGGPAEAFKWMLVGLIFALPSMLMGVTEAERLPRAVLARARRRGSRTLFAPWMPGGGRGVLLVAVNSAIVLAAAVIGVAVGRGSREDWTRALLGLAAVEAWLAFVLLLPSGTLARWLDRAWIQTVARIATVLFALSMLFLPTFGLFLAGASKNAFDHPGNPAHFAMSILERKGVVDVGGLALLGVGLLVAIAINVPRIARSLGEVGRARTARAPQGEEPRAETRS